MFYMYYIQTFDWKIFCVLNSCRIVIDNELESSIFLFLCFVIHSSKGGLKINRPICKAQETLAGQLDPYRCQKEKCE